MVMRERKGTIDGYEWRCRTKGGENPHDSGAKSNERGTFECYKGVVVPGSVIISDCWKAYNCLSHEGYQHLRVNHSLTFKDPESGAHTNSIEGTWSAIKRSLRNHAAHVEGQFDHYLAEYMWRRRRGHSLEDDVFREFLRAITTLYPPMEKDVPSQLASLDKNALREIKLRLSYLQGKSTTMSVIAHKTEKEWISANKKSRQRMSQTQTEGAAKHHAARLEEAHLRAHHSCFTTSERC
ncbi:putative transposase-like protein [Trichonephila clavipes]|nr:putative transposase-like protein [Trichonephila clavipes]